MSTLRIALRSWVKAPLFVAIAVGTIALAIGANTMVFSLVNTILLRDLPYPGSDRMVYVWNTYPKQGLEKATLSVPDYLDRKDLPAFEASALYHSRSLSLAEEGALPERVRALRVTPSFFALFGARFHLGRGFLETEAQHEADKFAVLTHGFWQTRFAGRPDIVGQTLRLNGQTYAIVGVAAPDFLPPFREIALFVPFAFSPQEASDAGRGNEFAYMAARLKPDATIAQAMRQAEAALQPVIERIPIAKSFVASTGFGPLITNYLEDTVGETRPLLLLLQGGVVLLLVVACANVANLLLLRAVARQREMAIRTALGASLGQLARQLLTEGLLLSLTGGTLGVLLSVWGLDLVRRIGLADLPRMRELTLDANVLTFSLVVAVATGLVFGLAPLLAVRREISAEALKDANTAATAGRSTGWLRNVLIAAEVAVAVVLLAGSALLARSFLKLREVPVGFASENVLTGSISIPFHRYDSDEKANAFYTRVLDGIRALPGVTHAGLTSTLPFSGSVTTGVYSLPGLTLPAGASPHANLRWVDHSYFRTLGIGLVRGRVFDQTDTLQSPKVAVIDEFMAQRYFAGRDPIGQQLQTGGDGTGPVYQIIGVVRTVRHGDLAEAVSKETIYFSSEQDARGTMTFVVRTATSPALLAPAIREVVRTVDAELPVYDLRTMHERIESSFDSRRAPLLLLTGFGAVALALAGLGIYGVIAFSVTQRVREIGIRMALGADRASVLRLILRQGLALTAIGAVTGVGLALAGGRFVRTLLYEIAPYDVPSLLTAAGVVTAVALCGSLVPAVRATRLNPLTALRND